jgi:hypothetical protein
MEAFIRLFMFSKCVLRVPPRSRGGRRAKKSRLARRQKLQATIAQRLSRWNSGDLTGLWHEAVAGAAKSHAATEVTDLARANIRRAIRIAEDGRYAKALATLVSHGFSNPNEKSIAAMMARHPSDDPPAVPSAPASAPIQFTADEVCERALSFPHGSAPGASGFRPQYLADLLQGPSGLVTDQFAQALTKFVNCMVAGKAPAAIAAVFSGAPLIALTKKDGSLRPIAIGETLRRLVSKCCCAKVADKTHAIFGHHQVGVSTVGGVEASVHAVRRATETYAADPGMVMLKVDFKNAFNLISRTEFLSEVKLHLPELFAWTAFSYSFPSLLIFGHVHLESQMGVQQGDPLGPLLFSLALHQLVRTLLHRVPGLAINLWYLDDGTLIGPIADVFLAYTIIQEHGPAIGSVLNRSKCELWWPSRPDNLDVFPSDVTRVDNAGVDLLGSPIGSAAFMTAYIMRKLTKLDDIDKQVAKMDDAQVELCLLRNCLGFGKLTHILRTCPPELITDAISSFDARLRRTLANIIRQPFLTADQWAHANLPIRMGGFGITSVTDIADPAYFGSVCLTHELVVNILGEHFADPAPTRISAVAARIGAATGCDAPVMADMIGHRKVQKLFMSQKEELALQRLATPDSERLAIIRVHTRNKHAGAWVSMPPISALHMRVENDAFRTQMRRWLGIQLSDRSWNCPKCGATMDVHGDHAGVCRMGNEPILRHNAVRDEFGRLAVDAGLATTIEELHLLPDFPSLKPADVCVRGLHAGARASAFDITFTSVLQSNNNHKAAADASYRAKEGHERKLDKFADQCRDAHIHFTPLSFDSFGGATEQVHSLILWWCRLAAARRRITVGAIKTSFYRRISAIILRFNSRAIIERSLTTDCRWTF